jgi:hypothetical protein
VAYSKSLRTCSVSLSCQLAFCTHVIVPPPMIVKPALRSWRARLDRVGCIGARQMDVLEVDVADVARLGHFEGLVEGEFAQRVRGNAELELLRRGLQTGAGAAAARPVTCGSKSPCCRPTSSENRVVSSNSSVEGPSGPNSGS